MVQLDVGEDHADGFARHGMQLVAAPQVGLVVLRVERREELAHLGLAADVAGELPCARVALHPVTRVGVVPWKPAKGDES